MKKLFNARKVSIASAYALFALAGVIFARLAAGLLGSPAKEGALLGAYGLFSFFVPAWLGLAGALLLKPVFSARSIFALDLSVVPFFTFAAGLSFMRGYHIHAENSPFIAALGRGGVSLTFVILAALEAASIAFLAYYLFPEPRAHKQSVGTRIRGGVSNSGVERGKAGTRAGAGAKEKTEIDMDAPFTIVKTRPEYFTAVGNAEEITLDEITEDMSPLLVSEDEALEIAESAPLEEAIEAEELLVTDTLQEADVFTQDENVMSIEDSLLVTEPLLVSDADETEPLLVSNKEEIEPLLVMEEIEETPALDCYEEITPFDSAEIEPIDSAEPLEVVDEILQEEDAAPPAPVVIQDDSHEKAVNEINEVRRMIKMLRGSLEDDTPLGAAPISSVAPALVPAPISTPLTPSDYSIPIDGVLEEYAGGDYWVIDDTTREAARILKDTLFEFNIEADVVGICKGPVITMFEVLPAPGVKLSRIVNLQDNIAMRLAAASVRIVAPIPGKHAVGIEIPNAKRNIVSFRELILAELESGKKRAEIPIVLGKDISGEAVTIDLASTPHLLIAGATGSGKSVCVNTLILSILYRRHPSACRLILVDPKIVELNLYNDIPHLLTPVITEPKRALEALQYCICEMERRYSCLDALHVRDIKSYNARLKEQRIAQEPMPYIVVVIDEFADLMATTGKELETTVARLTAKSRAVGIHLVLATQRPSTDVITGLIKSNVPSRIAFMVASQIDSRIIIDTTGAEKLLGKGDMLYSGIIDPFPVRMQGAFVSEEEVERVVEKVKALGEPDYIDDEIFIDEEDEDADGDFLSGAEDPLYERAEEVVRQQGKASASFIQRRLKIGYNRAARIVDEMEKNGLVGPAQGSKARELLRA